MPRKQTSSLVLSEQCLDREQLLAAVALVLGPETAYRVRLRAIRRLTHIEPVYLPLLLNTLNNYPEITTPPWPWWPPQYEYCGRLLLALSRRSAISLEALLQHTTLEQPPSPVL